MGDKLFLAVKHSDGSVETFGNTTEAIEIFKSAKSKNKRLSGVWIPKTDPPAQKLPLKEYCMNTKKVISEFRKIVRFFIGSDKFGVGENGQCLWDTLVDVENLFYTKPVIKKLNLRRNKISLSEVIEWKKLQTLTNLATHPPQNDFKMKLR